MNRSTLCVWTFILFPTITSAHDQASQENLEPSNELSPRLWVHICLMLVSFGLLFPLGIVFGLVRSRWHVPLQVFTSSLVAIGFYLGHHHGSSRYFGSNAHAKFSWIMLWLFIAQLLLGFYLKLHLERFFKDHLRKMLSTLHRWIGLSFLILGYVQVLFGVITAFGFCQNDHLGQCLAHFIMGSSFIYYGLALVLLLKLGYSWLVQRERPIEYYDNLLILTWGIFNTFTEHRWNEPWSHKDMQHTAMGILWWCGGMLGLYLVLFNRRRNWIPSLILILTGVAMGFHHQHTAISTKMHSLFGACLVLAGILRMVDVACFPNFVRPEQLSNFQLLPPFFLVMAGLHFMGSNEEMLALLSERMVDPFSYSMILSSIAFLILLYALVLSDVYQRLKPASFTHEYASVVADLQNFHDEIPVLDGGQLATHKNSLSHLNSDVESLQEFEMNSFSKI